MTVATSTVKSEVNEQVAGIKCHLPHWAGSIGTRINTCRLARRYSILGGLNPTTLPGNEAEHVTLVPRNTRSYTALMNADWEYSYKNGR